MNTIPKNTIEVNQEFQEAKVYAVRWFTEPIQLLALADMDDGEGFTQTAALIVGETGGLRVIGIGGEVRPLSRSVKLALLDEYAAWVTGGDDE